MELKKASIIGGITLLILITIITMILYNFIGPGASDIKASQSFIIKLYSINAIDTEKNLDEIKYERIKALNSQNSLVNRSIATQNYGIDLDKDDNVIGFAKKENPLNTTKLKVQDARILADKYLAAIYDGDVVLKTIRINEDSEYLPYYSIIYRKQKDGYSFYFDEIKLNINKENGLLDGYSNSTMQIKAKEPVIKISEEEAKKEALEVFLKSNKDGIAEDETDLVYVDNKMDKNEKSKYEVCYLVTVNGKNDMETNVSWKIFLNAENGDVFNILKDGAEMEAETH